MASRTGTQSHAGELTIRAVLLGAAITLVFTAANVYLGLKVGLTYASSIPAAVISMVVLRLFKTGDIRENNIVQTVASAAGTLSSIIFVLPGLVMIGWWTGFPFWTSFAICAFGGILGVMFSIPLRRALVANSPLPYPEGVAAAEVLRVGTQGGGADAENRRGLMVVLMGSLASAGYAALVGMRVCAGALESFVRVGASSATGVSMGLSLALMGAGHLVGLSVGLAMLAGLIIAWGVATPWLTALHPAIGAAADVATTVWRTQVRFIGAGAIGVAAIWALAKLAGPVLGGLASSFGARGAAAPERHEQDIPGALVALISVACLAPLAFLLWQFLHGGALATQTVPLIAAGVAFIIVGGFFVAAVCGYMAGLIGSSNSPLSGVGILAIVSFAALLASFALPLIGDAGKPALVAFALIVVAIVFSVATISNDNLQDLKTGQLVGASPWRQQVALIFGVIAGALVIPPILDLLNTAYGFAGADNTHAIVKNPLPAPQATLISTLAKGVIGGDLDWGLIGIGGVVGVGLIVLDEILGALKLVRLPPLAVGIGIYLPMATTMPVIVGALLGRAYDDAMAKTPDPDAGKRLGVLLASGMIVGESLFGVLLAGLIVATSTETPLAVVGDAFNTASLWLGGAVFVAMVAALYMWIARQARREG